MEQDPITANIASNARKQRLSLGWSARVLAEKLDQWAAPSSSSLTRSKIAKLECGKVTHLYAAEVIGLAAVLGVSAEQLAAAPGSANGEDVEGGAVSDIEPGLSEKITALEGRVGQLIAALGESGLHLELDQSNPEPSTGS